MEELSAGAGPLDVRSSLDVDGTGIVRDDKHEFRFLPFTPHEVEIHLESVRCVKKTTDFRAGSSQITPQG